MIEQQLREGEVLAPAGGRVLRVEVGGGAVVMPGEPVATLATDSYMLRLRLPERHARFIRAGDPVLVGGVVPALAGRGGGLEILSGLRPGKSIVRPEPAR